MKSYHILNGDCLADQLRQTKVNAHFIVCRECLIEGDLAANNITEFWELRAKFIANNYNTTQEAYFTRTVSEFEKLNNLAPNAEVCLWFENDLFCQVNMWFVISILANHKALHIYRIFPSINNQKETWKGFGMANADELEDAYHAKVKLSDKEIELGKNLWAAYQDGNFAELKELAKNQSAAFSHLQEVCQAHIDQFPVNKDLGRPEKTMKEIIDTGTADFETIFSIFSEKEGIYGFGDLQVKKIYDFILSCNKK